MSVKDTTSNTLDKVLKVAQEAARVAGKTILEAGGGSSDFQIKSSATDLVTETDQKCEELIKGIISKNFPTDQIIGEESSGSTKYELTDAPTWTIDPIDGTTNFVHQLKLSCVIICYLLEKKTKIAVIYDPYVDELFYAIHNHGAFLLTTACNGQIETTTPIKVSTATKSIPQAVISMDPGYGRDTKAVQRFCSLQSAILAKGVRNIRVIGSTGLNMTKVACGRLDAALEEGSWETGLGPKIWDFAAGKLLVEEAGGVTRDLEVPAGDLLSDENQGLDIMKRSFFCAATPELATELLQVIESSRYQQNMES